MADPGIGAVTDGVVAAGGESRAVVQDGAAFVEVAVQVPIRGTFHYQLPPELRGRSLLGCRVLVPFGRRGVTGVVVREDTSPPEGVDRILPVEALLDGGDGMSPELMRLCLWIADYYEAPPGEVFKAAFPGGSQVVAEPLVELTDGGREALAGEGAALGRAQRELLARLANGPLRQSALGAAAGRAAALEASVRQGLVAVVWEARRPRVGTKLERVVRLGRPLSPELQSELRRAPRRLAVLQAIAAAGDWIEVSALRRAIPGVSSHLRELVRAGWVESTERAVRRGGPGEATAMTAPALAPRLTPAQQSAVEALEGAIRERQFRPFLLHGVTGSGKTEVYLHAIGRALESGGGAVVLVPEISLTPQLAARFRARFGDRVAVLHSGLGDGERFDEWTRIRRGEAGIALGARSAIFAPVSDLRIVVVDEEHDASFKQEEGVRYCARDVALVRAQRAGAVCVLGSATPSVESFHAAQLGRYGLLQLPERATASPLPQIELIDLRRYRADGEGMLTAPLAQAIDETLERGEQTILFLNRRGFATFVLCVACGHGFRCRNCSVSLTYHRGRDRLVCHYCGYTEGLARVCPSCAAENTISRRGIGTERVAMAVTERFPAARVARLDRDVASGTRIQVVLERFARREIDILVGTQMVTKGHDFPAVTLVGVLCADTGLSLPDFRAAERTFQLLAQVAGRAGRAGLPGRVLIQTYRPDASAIAAAQAHDFGRFVGEELGVREELGYPPFGHLAAVRLDGPDAAAVQGCAEALAARVFRWAQADESRSVSVLGPCEAPLARLKGRTRWHLWLRASERAPLRRLVRRLLAEGTANPGVRLGIDIDPVSAL
jgi:primosomal protein N' (replication factor Y)